jgi:hypothetical protein
MSPFDVVIGMAIGYVLTTLITGHRWPEHCWECGATLWGEHQHILEGDDPWGNP